MWEQIGTELILGLIGLIISGLGILITHLINKYVKNDTVRGYLNELREIVFDVVQEVQQTYVNDLKEKGFFNKEAQQHACEMALHIIENSLSKELKAWLEKTYPDAQEFLITLIESTVFAMKK